MKKTSKRKGIKKFARRWFRLSVFDVLNTDPFALQSVPSAAETPQLPGHGGFKNFPGELLPFDSTTLQMLMMPCRNREDRRKVRIGKIKHLFIKFDPQKLANAAASVLCFI
ncbi:MAG: hypothetical protein ACREDQ_12655, partial [Limisphaerales bacterium]